jgi:S1-C subfamily serine protease
MSKEPLNQLKHMRNFPLSAALLLSLLASSARAEFVSFEKASAQLQAATVTVRVIPQAAVDGEGDAAKAESANEESAPKEADKDLAPDSAPAPRSVVVCSGASLGGGLVVTYANISESDEVRITIPGGDQAKAQLRVLDHLSGLTLLEIDKKDVPALASAAEMPAVGAWVLAGAGWGPEKPVVSFGILSATSRALRGTSFPPLLQCDLRTAETSSGAPLVNANGELVGIVVATDAPGSENRWTYAVPVDHVQRLVRARLPDKMIELHRRRPIVGLNMIAGETAGSVLVVKVEKGGPAEKAGIRLGDQILAAEGVKIRSVYEVLRPLIAKQPGDNMRLLVQQGETQKVIDIKLDGGNIVQESATYAQASGTAPAGEVRIVNLGYGKAFNVTREGQGQGQSVGPSGTAGSAKERLLEQELELKQRAVDHYGVALETMKSELKRRDQDIAQRDALIQSLRSQLESAQKATK